MNNIQLLGRLTKDVELYVQTETPMAKFSIAVDKRFKKDGEPTANFFNCVAFGKTAENISKFFKKGNMIAINGSVEQRAWEDATGVKRYNFDIHVQNFYFTGEKREGSVNENFAVDTGNDDVTPF